MSQNNPTYNGKKWSNALLDRVELADYNKNWPKNFEKEKAKLLHLIPTLNPDQIHHVGSTAVESMKAKPVIDIVIASSKTEVWDNFIEPIEELGYKFWKENPSQNAQFYVKGMPPFGKRRTHHIHVITVKAAKKIIKFRNLLRTYPSIAKEYEQLKESLQERFPTDREAYGYGKSEFIKTALINY